MVWLKKSTIVRLQNRATGVFFRRAEWVVPGVAGRLACQLWFSAPPRMAESPVPLGGQDFTVSSQGATVRGQVWGADGSPVVYLVHGWGGRASQFGTLIEPLLVAGFRVVTFDAPAHGESERVPGAGRTANGIQFAKALDEVFLRFGPAEAVIAHSLGTIATYLELRFGWLGTQRLVFIAPMVEALSLFDQFQAVLGFGPRTRRGFDAAVLDSVGLPVEEFDARVQAAYSRGIPTLVLADRGDKQTPYADAADFAQSVGAEFVTTEGLGHRRILRDPDVVRRVVQFAIRSVAEDAVA